MECDGKNLLVIWEFRMLILPPFFSSAPAIPVGRDFQCVKRAMETILRISFPDGRKEEDFLSAVITI